MRNFESKRAQIVHIFLALGLWDDVVASNIVAYKAADDLATKMNLPRGREDSHTLSWLQYAYLQQGKFDDAAKALATAKAVADKDPSPGVANGYASMKARTFAMTASLAGSSLSVALSGCFCLAVPTAAGCAKKRRR